MRALICGLAFLLAACSPSLDAPAPAPAMASSASTQAVLTSGAAVATIDTPANRNNSAPLDELAVAAAEEAANPVRPMIDASCEVDADCAIKDVGSCCGTNPRCINVNSPTFPERVKADCRKQGCVGICGFPAISGCQCVQGKCEGVGAGSSVQ